MSPPQLVAETRSDALPVVDASAVPGDDVREPWPFCTELCRGSRNERACPLITQYVCCRCRRVTAYLVHGLRAECKRRFFGNAKILHLWPSFEAGNRTFCNSCALSEHPRAEAVIGESLEEAWRKRRDFDHINEVVEMIRPYRSDGSVPRPSEYKS